MGIKDLSKLIGDNAPGAIKESKIESLFGRRIAVDASMAIYQFLIAVRQAGGEGQLTNEAGEVTSHLTGMLYRTIRMMEAGIKPVFVFDGKPPTMKSGQLAKRKERQQAAEAELTRLQSDEGASAEDIERQQKRTVRATKEQSEEVKKLLTLMGVPVVDAPCEAEATCAALAKAGKVYATGTEDMDALTFGTPVMVRNLNASESKKLPIVEITLEKALAGMGVTMEQFTDVCILCGCDYVDTIKGVGSKSALELIRKHGTIEAVLAANAKLEKPKEVPDPFPFDEARQLFVNAEVVDPEQFDFKWGEPDVPGLLQYLVEEKQFGDERVKKAIDRLQKCKGKGQQNRMESFFKPIAAPNGHKPNKPPEPVKGKGKASLSGKAKGGPAAKKMKK